MRFTSGEQSKGKGGTFGRLNLFNTHPSQSYLLQPLKPHNFTVEWE